MSLTFLLVLAAAISLLGHWAWRCNRSVAGRQVMSCAGFGSGDSGASDDGYSGGD